MCTIVDYYDEYDSKEMLQIGMNRHTINTPRFSNLWNLFGLGWFYGARSDILID